MTAFSFFQIKGCKRKIFYLSAPIMRQDCLLDYPSLAISLPCVFEKVSWVDAGKDIFSAITAYREERGWTEYQLAEHSGLPRSTISSWYRKNMVATIPSLKKLAWLLATRFLSYLQKIHWFF